MQARSRGGDEQIPFHIDPLPRRPNPAFLYSISPAAEKAIDFITAMDGNSQIAWERRRKAPQERREGRGRSMSSRGVDRARFARRERGACTSLHIVATTHHPARGPPGANDAILLGRLMSRRSSILATDQAAASVEGRIVRSWWEPKLGAADRPSWWDRWTTPLDAVEG